MARARKKLAALESPESKVYRTVPEAVDRFMEHCSSIDLETRRKYNNTLNRLKEFCDVHNVLYAQELTVEKLDTFRSSRQIAPITATKELQLLRQFCGFCLDRRWMEENSAKKIKMPSVVSANDTEPFTSAEVAAILAACDRIGQQSYERIRARAMVMTLRYTALRIGDVSMLERNRITHDGRRWRVFLRTEKNGKPVFMPIPNELKSALDALPIPKGCGAEPKHYFWNGTSKPRSMKKSADDTLRSVFRASGVKGAHAHRFRHTLATELLENGASFEDVADVLGNTVDIVRKHYAKWSPKRQARIDDLLERVHSAASYAPVKLRRIK
ncbi:MAG TPA: tyrosine-type recombinase/integrase [Edaphobacter sp.]|nr:tyrosine-type recombinase/integrase [Edaphobacter sp.]